MPTKKTKEHISPKYVFLHLLVIVTLYAFAISLITLWFQIINLHISDPLDTSYYYRSATSYLGPLRFALATMIIVFPSYVSLTWLLNREYTRHTALRESRLRKWLIYFTLFVGALIIGGDIIGIVYSFLEGELTIRFLLKSLTILVVSASLFAYYLVDVRIEISARHNKYIALGAIIVTLLSIITGFSLGGSPQNERLYRLDNERVVHLQQIDDFVQTYWNAHNVLPQTLDQVNPPTSSFMIPVDPLTNQPYIYRIVNAQQFELCATFAKESREPESAYPSTNNWKHRQGYYCFQRTVTNKPALDIKSVPLDESETLQ